MSLIIHAVCVYAMVWLFFRLAGKRTCSDMTAFDFVLLLIVAEAIQEALVHDDPSLTAAFAVVGTMIGIDVALSMVKQRFPRVEKLIDGVPIVLVKDGVPQQDRMRAARIDIDDILSEARRSAGLKRTDQIEFAVLEQNGRISIIPHAPRPAADD